MTSATDNISVIRVDASGLSLWRAGEPAPMPLEHPGDLPENTVFAAPSDAVRLLVLEVADEEIRHLRKALPFRLEEEVAEDIDALHFAFCRVLDGESTFLVAVARQAAMADWRAVVPASVRWVPEAMLLPWRPGDACVLIEGEQALVRLPDGSGARVETELLAPVLEAANPDDIVIYTGDGGGASQLLPEALQSRAQIRVGNLGAALRLTRVDDLALDLRQGAFAPQLPLAAWWQQWQRVAMAAGFALVLQFAADLADVQRLGAQNLALRAAIQDSYRRANPRGAVVDVEKQLDRQLAEFGSGDGLGAFTPVLYAVTTAVAGVEGLGLTTLNYTGAGDVRISINAPDFAAVETLRSRLTAASLSATLESSNASSDGVRARLRVGGGA